MAAPYPVGSSANGGIVYSDGSVRAPASSATNNNALNSPQSVYKGKDPYAITPKPSTGGGGGSSAPQPGQNGYISPINTDMTDINKQIDEAYNPTMQYLGQAEGNLRNDFPTIQNEIGTLYDLQGKSYDQNKTNAFTSLDNQQQQGYDRNNDVMADARRLYDELRRGYGQRFGGASSAGQAATELGNLEQQRQQGRTQREYTSFTNEINAKRTEIEQGYALKVEKLGADRIAALNDAQREFQNKLLQIQQSRAETEAAKGQAKLSALQDLRNKAYQIDLMNTQFQQQLALQRTTQSQQLDSYISSVAGSVQSGQNSLQSTLSSPGMAKPASNLQTSTSTLAQANPYVGRISSNKDDESLIGQISPSYRGYEDDGFASLLA